MTKWSPFSMRHIQTHFLVWKSWYFDSDLAEMCSYGSNSLTHIRIIRSCMIIVHVQKSTNKKTCTHTKPRHLCLYNSFICSILFSRPLPHWYHDNIYMIVIHIEMYHLVCNCHLYFRCYMLACIQCNVLSRNRINCPICSALVTIYV